LFFLLAYGISLLLWSPALIQKNSSRLTLAFLSAGTFGPTLAALITERISAGNWRAVRIWTGLRNLLTGIAAGGLAVLLSAFITAFAITKSGIGHWQWLTLLQILTLFVPNLLGGPLGEEAGWRGYALPRLQAHLSPFTSSLIIGFLWANWHLPLIFIHVYNVTWWQFVPLTMAASVFLTLCFNKSEGSTLAPIIVHGLYNVGTGIILNDLVSKATLRSNAAQHNIIWIVYVSVAIFIACLTKGNLGRNQTMSLTESAQVLP
jgi:membrane protease YdiL (CAAX protease family)